MFKVEVLDVVKSYYDKYEMEVKDVMKLGECLLSAHVVADNQRILSYILLRFASSILF